MVLKNLYLLVCCRLFGVYIPYADHPLKEPRVQYGHKLLCRSGYVLRSNYSIVNDNNKPISKTEIMNPCRTQQECIQICYANCVDTVPLYFSRKCDDPQIYDAAVSGWGFYVEFLPNKLKRPILTEHKPPNKQDKVKTL